MTSSLLRVDPFEVVAEDRTLELVCGEISERASPRFGHSRAQLRFARLLANLDSDDPDDVDGWWFGVEPDCVDGRETLYRPDVAGWRRTTLPEPPVGRVQVRPDWIAEILSPGHEAYDRVTKRNLYHRLGVGHLWLVSVEDRVVEAFRRTPEGWQLVAAVTDGEPAVLEPFPVPVVVGSLFLPRRRG